MGAVGMSDEIKPVAWVERTEDGHDRMWSGDLSAWANRPANPEPLYDQATVDALRRDAARWRFGVQRGFPLFGYFGRSDGAAEWGICVTAGEKHVGSSAEQAIDAAMKGANAGVKR